MNAHAKILLRKDFVKKDGTYPIYLRITINRTLKYYSLNISVKQDSWISDKYQVKKSYPDSFKMNIIISDAINRANDIIFDFAKDHKTLTIGEFNRFYSLPGINSNSFYEFVSREIESLKPKFSYYTIKTYKGHISKLKSYYPNLVFSDITPSFIKEYDNYLIKRGNCENTRLKAKTVLKSLLNKAIIAGHIKENPYNGIKIGSKAGNRAYLSCDELKILEELYNKELTKPIKNVLRYFLFACYTGLRYQDVKSLRYSEISDGIIKLVMHKTKDLVTIPLSNRAKNIINTGLPNQNVFRVFTNLVTNRYLKDIIALTDINKKITFHCARHTFATYGITINIPIEVISKLLGHKNLKETHVYAKILGTVKIREME